MVNKRAMGGMVAALSFFFVFPALASAHLLAVSAGPSHCVTPLNGQYTATVTVTETYFGGTTEDIPVGQNVYEVLASSTDKGNTGKNQNYFTTGAVGTQSGTANLGQPTIFTSPASGGAATQQFTVTTSVPETYVLGNSYMSSPSSATITAPSSGCTPPPPPTCPTGDTLVNGKCVPPTSCPSGTTLSGGVLRAADDLPEWRDADRWPVRAADHLPQRGHADRGRLHPAGDRAAAHRVPGRVPGLEPRLQGPGRSGGHDRRVGQPPRTAGGGRHDKHHRSGRQGRNQVNRQQRQGDVLRQADAQRDHRRPQPELQRHGQGEGLRRQGGHGPAGPVLHRVT